ncbi:unnamed protein product [Oppiella nova]|uniref:Bacterial type II secretion system protein E domain-containing protein n=1 Tax=Oppiella nova TaxID=334625 RepID=A0A7R9L8J0_9ACAR|nr:unnamed protein product [Oppiella nova]CAG2159521.1 unnamed protein product [Oppiella nova]
MSMQNGSPKFSGYIRRLVDEGFLSAQQMKDALSNAQKNKVSIVAYLSEKLNIPPLIIAEMISEEFGEPIFDLDSFNPEMLPKELIDPNLVSKHKVIPLVQRGNILYVATSDPTNIEALDAIRFNCGLNIEPIIVEHHKLEKYLEKHFTVEESFNFGDEDFDVDIIATDDTPPSEDDDEASEEEAPIVKYINKLLVDAIRMGASDLHFEPYEKSYRVRYRVDGVLRTITNPPLQLASRLASRLKVMSRMDISEKRVPQDGRIKLKLSKTKAIDFRVNSLPTLFGEKLVLRILDPSSAMLGIDALGINQVNVNLKAGLTFSVALKSFLRQDPDIIMVGEIRDLETAEIAIKAAQTGHMVMSTLHTNSAPETLTRLRNMGVPSFNIATSVNLVIAQRLARRLCNHCKAPVEIPRQSLLEMGFTEQDLSNPDLQIFQPVGCSECREGYKGRVGIYEVMKVTPEISKIIMEDGNALQIAAASEKLGFDNLRRSGLIKVINGLTSLQEINRVTSE